MFKHCRHEVAYFLSIKATHICVVCRIHVLQDNAKTGEFSKNFQGGLKIISKFFLYTEDMFDAKF